MQNNLSSLIKKEYLKSIIVPLLVIESMLLVAYFWSNTFVTETTKTTLVEESRVNIKKISARSAMIINNEFTALANVAVLFQKEHENFFKHYNPLHVNTQEHFYKTTQSGVITNDKNTQDSCTLFYSNINQNMPNRMEKAIASESLDYFYNAILSSNRNIGQVYFNSFDSMNRLCPFMPDALEQYAHDIEIPKYNFYYLADKEHNVDKKVVWTDAYLDPAGLGWMISAIAPVYKNDFLEGVVGLDVTIDKLIKNILATKLPYESLSMLVDKNGNILAMSENLDHLLGLNELNHHEYTAPVEQTISKPKDFNLFQNKDHSLAIHLGTLLRENKDFSSFKDEHTQFLITQNSIDATGWTLFVLIDEGSLVSPLNALKNKTNLIGYSALFVMGVFYLIFLLVVLKRSDNFSKRILDTLQRLIQATNDFKGRLTIQKLEHSDISEINILLDNFTSMSIELQELYESMEKKINAGILEKMETQKMMIYQSRLAQMGEMISMIAHQWRQPLGSISTVSASIKLKQELHKFDLETPQGRAAQAEFLNTATDKIENYISFLTTTIDDFRDFFKPDQKQEKTTLQSIIEQAMKIIGKSLEVNRIALHVENKSEHELVTYDKKMTQVVINLLKNAQDALIERKVENATIWVRTYEENETFMVEVEDNAGGIDISILDKIFDPYFSTKSEKNGTGLGLYMSKTIVQEHCHGSLNAINTDFGVKFIIKIRGE